ncbi:hypothetical protein NQZ68_002471 [Dissostichus eleginoides]|nr:hypothetical protein NQZ68_002471 [Dissostichus eleginoides]
MASGFVCQSEDDCKKAQLVDIAEHYKIAVVGSKRKDEIKAVIVSSLFEQGVLQKSGFGAAGVVPVVVQTAGLTFEQQKELLAMQFEQEKLRFEQEKLRLEEDRLQLSGQQQEVEKRLEVEKVLEVENMKCVVEHARLRLIGEVKLSSRWCTAAKVASFDGLCELIILEQFKEVIPQRVATYRSVLGVIGDVEKMVAIPAVVQSFHQAPPVDLQVRGDPRAPEWANVIIAEERCCVGRGATACGGFQAVGICGAR